MSEIKTGLLSLHLSGMARQWQTLEETRRTSELTLADGISLLLQDSSWERGLNEYSNSLVRQYIPKKQSFGNYSDDDLVIFQQKINTRPRKLLNFDSPLNRMIFYINNKVAFIT